MFTSCCPGWIRLVEQFKPEYIKNLFSAKPPQQIFGTASKNYYPYIENLDPKSVFTVSLMPCVAKKVESERDEMNTNGIRNIDAVLTTRELADLIKTFKIDFNNLKDSEVDLMMGTYTGAGTIFGVTGGVMEAALRSVKDILENNSFNNIEYNIAVVNGGANIFKFFDHDLLTNKNLHHSLFYTTYFNRKK